MGEIIPVGVDLGYGRTKVAAGPEGKRRVSFLSSYAPYEAARLGFGGDVAEFSVDHGPTYIVGDLAARMPGHVEPLGDGRLADPETLPLLGAALWESGVEGEIVLVSGVPRQDVLGVPADGRCFHLPRPRSNARTADGIFSRPVTARSVARPVERANRGRKRLPEGSP